MALTSSFHSVVRSRSLARTGYRIATLLVASLAASGMAFCGEQRLPSPESSADSSYNEEPVDFLGRWTWEDDQSDADAPTRAPAFLDIVACGKELCGIEVLKTGACAGVILRFHDQGLEQVAADRSERYSGRLAWTGKYPEYAVLAYVGTPDYTPLKAGGPKRLELDGEPTDPSARWERIYPFVVTFNYSGKAACTVPSS